MSERDLAARARDSHIVVIGASLEGLFTAWQCASLGIPVTVLEATGRTGGAAAPALVDGSEIPRRRPTSAPAGLADLLAPLGAFLTPDERPAPRIVTAAGTVAAPADTVVGIPRNPWADDVRRLIGWRGAWRAYLDRIRPPLTIGREESLGALVERRMGAAVADRVVQPIAGARYESAIELLDADAVVPGINAALTRAGSLSVGLAQIAPTPDALLAVSALAAALENAAVELGASVRRDTRAVALARVDEQWHIEIATDAAPEPPEQSEHPEQPPAPADAVIIATGQDEARTLLGDLAHDPALTEDVPLVVDHFFSAPAVPADASALAFAEADLFRAETLTGEATETPVIVVTATPDTPAETIAAAAARLGATPDTHTAKPPTPHTATRRISAAAGRRIGDARRTRDVRAALHAHPGLFAVGGWLGGGDPGDALLDARDEAERARRGVLFGDEARLADPDGSTQHP